MSFNISHFQWRWRYIVSLVNLNYYDSGFYLHPTPPLNPFKKLRICAILMTWYWRGWRARAPCPSPRGYAIEHDTSSREAAD